MMIHKVIMCIFVGFLSIQSAQAFPGATKAARELTEWVLKKGGSKAAKELAAYGGEKALKESLEKVVKESGEAVAGKVVVLTKEHGILTFKALVKNPKVLTEALEKVPASLSKQAARALERNADELAELAVKHGSNALEIAARQPGVGVKMLGRFGDDIIPLGKKLTEKQFMDFTRYADDFAGMPASVRGKNLDFLTKYPQKALDFLEAHPTVLKTAAGVGLILVLKDDVVDVIVGEPEIGEDGRPMPRDGVVHTAMDKGTDFFAKIIDELAKNPILVLGIVFLVILPKLVLSMRVKKE